MSKVWSDQSRKARFDSTRWSLVLAAGAEGASGAGRALQTLCEAYWPPIYAYVRREGHQPAEAQDLTQGFFALLLQRDDIRSARPEKGRFRSFLLTALKHFLINEGRKARAVKRGGGHLVLSLDFDSAESQLSLQPADRSTPESLFHRQWALTLLANVQDRLQGEMEASDRGPLFTALQPHLVGEADTERYAAIAGRLDMTEAAVKMAMTRLRKRYRELLRYEIAQTVACEADIDDEIHELFDALRRPGS